MRVLCDTNVFVSYLLIPDSTGAVATIVQAAFQGQFHLLLPEEVVQELITVTKEKIYLSKRIPLETVTTFVQILKNVAEYLPSIPELIPQVSRDAKDNYLLAHALIGQA